MFPYLSKFNSFLILLEHCLSFNIFTRQSKIRERDIKFYFGGHFRSLEVIRRLNTGFVAALVFPGSFRLIA